MFSLVYLIEYKEEEEKGPECPMLPSQWQWQPGTQGLEPSPCQRALQQGWDWRGAGTHSHPPPVLSTAEAGVRVSHVGPHSCLGQ